MTPVFFFVGKKYSWQWIEKRVASAASEPDTTGNPLKPADVTVWLAEKWGGLAGSIKQHTYHPQVDGIGTKLHGTIPFCTETYFI